MEATSMDLGLPTRVELRCRAKDGSQAAIERGEGGAERLVVRDAEARPLFAYEPVRGRCVVYAPSGDLELRAPEGQIILDAARGLHLRSGAAMELEGEVLTTTFRRVRQTIDLLETRAGRIVERARESYREVEGLAQLRAENVRTVAVRTFHVLGTRAVLKARKDMKIKGEKIHLG